MTFGQNLREARRDTGHAQRSLAARVGVDFSYISKVENDRIPPPAGTRSSASAASCPSPPEPLLALSRKVPAEVAGAPAASPGAVGFLRKAAAASLTETGWERLTCTLDRLRPPSGGQEPAAELPESMRDLFWEHRFEDLSWAADRDFHRPHPERRGLGLGDLAARAGRAGPAAPVADPAPVQRPGRPADPLLGADARPAGGPVWRSGCGRRGRGVWETRLLSWRKGRNIDRVGQAMGTMSMKDHMKEGL